MQCNQTCGCSVHLTQPHWSCCKAEENARGCSQTFHWAKPNRQSNRNIMRVISDIHLVSHWFDRNSQQGIALAKIFSEMAEPKTFVHTLVLNGDIIETWSHSCHSTPKTVEEILDHDDVKWFSNMVKKIIQNGVRVIYIQGNHDSRLEAHHLKKETIFGSKLIFFVKNLSLLWV